MENLRSQIAQLEKEKKSASEDDQFSYTTQIQTAQMDLKKSEYERKSKEVEISQIHEKIANSSVTSEMQGVVKSINEGNETDPYSGSSQAFMTILATGVYRVKGKVNEQNIGAVQEGQKAIIRSRVDESKTWTGTFTAVDTENREGNNNNMMYGGGSDSGEMMSSSYPFYINLDTSDGLMLGQHVYIENDTGMEEKEGIWLDEGFIMDADKQPCVWVENKDGKLEKRDVTLGEHDENLFQYQIKSGLKVSDYIAFPQEFLKEGMKTTHEEIPMSDRNQCLRTVKCRKVWMACLQTEQIHFLLKGKKVLPKWKAMLRKVKPAVRKWKEMPRKVKPVRKAQTGQQSQVRKVRRSRGEDANEGEK
ncbi:HlyD family efflux transporter periplasmic adaptor subunit [Blautia sp. RD014234]|nr:HlyD family efflux transporter periplasmic adaptor subunit [Blautia parvula]